MLQQFIVENFLSFKNREIFSLQPSKGTLKKEHKTESIKGQWVLKSAAMFGANAGGKSNFVKAIELGKKLVLRGTRTDDLIDFYPFRLSSENKKKDTTIIYHILCDNKKYEYGFSYNAEQISSEWLKQINRSNDCIIFQRETEKSEFDISYLLDRKSVV